mmetsp:Transcript_89750/g.250945  ORF Transcript_89750/g.250945 Transcript_89750/m.250945 type:complete len:327 (-) Transcript_89750:52-1032(-)
MWLRIIFRPARVPSWKPSVPACVGRSPPRSILEKTRPSCQTLFETWFGRPSTISGAWRRAEMRTESERPKQETWSSSQCARQARRRSTIIVCLSSLRRWMFLSVRSPCTTSSFSISATPRSTSIISGTDFSSGTKGFEGEARARSQSAMSMSRLRSPAASANTHVDSGYSRRSSTLGTKPVRAKSFDMSRLRSVAGSWVRQTSMATPTRFVDRQMPEPTSETPSSYSPLQNSTLPGSSFSAHSDGRRMVSSRSSSKFRASTGTRSGETKEPKPGGPKAWGCGSSSGSMGGKNCVKTPMGVRQSSAPNIGPPSKGKPLPGKPSRPGA